MRAKTEREVLEEYYEQIVKVLDTIKVGVFITDGQGKVIMLNKESERTGGLQVEEVVGRNMQELQEQGYVDESSVLKAIEIGHEVQMIQNLGDGSRLYLTAVPYYKGDSVELVVCTERDITETGRLEKLLRQSEEKTKKQEKELEYLRTKTIGEGPRVIARSSAMRNLLISANRIAKLDTTVLISGESGTGKEVIADFIYRTSHRVQRPYIKINCAAIPENLLESELFGYEKGAFTGANTQGKIGIFELAQEGTLFLDEIAEVPLRLQAKLLRVLQEKEIRRIGGKITVPVNVRIIAATNVDLKLAIDRGEFREDLYYRLNILPLEIPPLRERREDIEALAEHFVQCFNEEYQIHKSISTDAMEELKRGQWKGNIRELRNMIERIIVSFDGEQITSRQVKNLMFTPEGKTSWVRNTEFSLPQLMEEYEREILVHYLEKYANASEAAHKLHIDKSTMSRKLQKYGLYKK